jgi:hypothetical protein
VEVVIVKAQVIKERSFWDNLASCFVLMCVLLHRP